MAYRNTPSSTRNRSARPSGNRPGVRSFRPGKSGARNGQKRGAYIHPSKFINRAVTRAQETPYEATHQFTHRLWRMHIRHFRFTKAPTQEWLEDHSALLADMATLESLPLPTAMKVARAEAIRILLQQ